MPAISLVSYEGSTEIVPTQSYQGGTVALALDPYKGDPARNAAQKAVSNLMKMLDDIALENAIDSAFAKLEPNIIAGINGWADNNADGRCYLPSAVGVLIHLIYYQYNAPIGQKGPKRFVDMFIGDYGTNASEVVVRYMGTPGYYPVGPANTKTIWRFMWYTL
ncbi:MAG: hypothetical protein U1F68_11600 [Gammaproteobacteria bacterium]